MKRYHFECIMDNELPDDQEDMQLLCRRCIKQYPWIIAYAESIPVGVGQHEKVSQWIRLERQHTSSIQLEHPSQMECSPAEQHTPISLDAAAELYLLELDNSAAMAQLQSVCSKPNTAWFKQPDLEVYDCLIQPNFWDRLCQCEFCATLYEGPLAFVRHRELDVAYMPPASAPVPTESDLMNMVTTTLTSTQQRNVGHAMNSLRDKMREFLIPYAQSSKVVSTEDVKKWSETLLQS
jgi:hypothetical protein